jgi:hypothetical protein
LSSVALSHLGTFCPASVAILATPPPTNWLLAGGFRPLLCHRSEGGVDLVRHSGHRDRRDLRRFLEARCALPRNHVSGPFANFPTLSHRHWTVARFGVLAIRDPELHSGLRSGQPSGEESPGTAQHPGFSFCFRRPRQEPTDACRVVETAGRPPPTVSPRARPVTQGAVENGCVLVFFGGRPGFPSQPSLTSEEWRSSSMSRSTSACNGRFCVRNGVQG